jgi:DNA-binding MarR family transcriptional regulator
MSETYSKWDSQGTGDFAYNDAPSVLIFSDNEEGAHTARSAVEAAGARVGGSVGLSDAINRLNVQLSVDAIMVELADDAPALVDPLLDRIELMAARERIPALVSVPFGLLDVAAARVSSGNIAIMCQPNLADRVAALGLSLGSQRLQFQDVTAELDQVRLRRLADEVSRIAQTLARLTPQAPSYPQPSSMGPTSGSTAQVNDMMIGFRAEPVLTPIEMDAPSAAEIRTMIRLRRLRDQHFDSLLFADPAWDMLLDLMAARLERSEVAVSSLCIAAAVPPTTALRWIKSMTDAGMFERLADPDDGRRIFIRLADRTAEGMAGYLAAAKRMGGLTV